MSELKSCVIRVAAGLAAGTIVLGAVLTGTVRTNKDPEHEEEPAVGVSRVEELNGKTVDDVVAQLGAPTETHEFTIGELDVRVDFRSHLYLIYPPDVPGNADVRIKELLWRYPAYSLKVWLNRVGDQWVVVDTRKWGKRVVF